MLKLKNLCLMGIAMPIGQLLFAQTTKKAPEFVSKNGIGLVMPDSSFSINFRFRTQNRVGIAADENELGNIKEADFRVRRMRLRFEGFAVNPKLTYQIQLSFTRDDQDWDNSGVPLVLRDALVHYRLLPNLRLSLGVGKLPGNRQRVVSSGDIHFTDRSIVNGAYTLDRDAGLFAVYTLKPSKTYKGFFLIKSALSSGEGRGINGSSNARPNGGICYTGRIEFLPFGEFTNNGDYFEGDIERETEPKLSLGGTYSYNDRAIRTQGQLGSILLSPRSFIGTNLDLLFKWKGLAFSAEYIDRTMAKGQNNFTYSKNKLDSTAVLTGAGINMEISFTTKKLWEFAIRYAETNPKKALWNLATSSVHTGKKNQEYLFTINKYFRKHRVKIVNEFGYYQRTNLISKTRDAGRLGFKMQFELGI